jgi:hypothetical protein
MVKDSKGNIQDKEDFKVNFNYSLTLNDKRASFCLCGSKQFKPQRQRVQKDNWFETDTSGFSVKT